MPPRSALLRVVLLRVVLPWAVLLVMLFGTGPADAQPAGRFDATEEVLLVEVPVEVLAPDSHRPGLRPLRGLTREDFRLSVGGEEVPVAEVEEIDLDAGAAPRRGLQTSSQSGPGRAPGEALPAAARRHVLFLFDLGTLSPADGEPARAMARDAVLHHLAAGDRAAVATLDPTTGPRFHSGFTTDRARVARAISALATASGAVGGGGANGAPSFFPPSRDVRREPRTDDLGAELERIDERRRGSDRELGRRRAAQWASSLAEVARALAVIEGPTHVVLLSGGWDGSLVRGLDTTLGPEAERRRHLREHGAIQRLDPAERYGEAPLRRQLEATVALFQDAGCRVHVFDPAWRRAEAGGEDRPVAEAPAWGPLLDLADRTGGAPLHRFGARAASELGQILRREALIYVIAFYPPRSLYSPRSLAGDRDRWTLEVEVPALEAARIVHRRALPAARAFRDLAPIERDLLAAQTLAEATPPSQLEVEMLVVPFPAARGAAYVPVLLEIAGGSLASPSPSPSPSPSESPEPARSEPETRLEVYLYATDAAGRMGDFVAQEVELDASQTPARDLQIYAELELAPGEHSLRALVRRTDDGRSTALQRTLHVPDGGVPVVLPPLVLPALVLAALDGETGGAARRARRVRLEGEGEGAGEDAPGTESVHRERGVVYPFVAEGRPFVPAALPRLSSCLPDGGDDEDDEEAEEVDDEAHVVYLFVYGFTTTPEVASRIGTERDVLRRIEDLGRGPDGRRVLRAHLDPGRIGRGELPAGRHRLEVEVVDREGETRASSSVPLLVACNGS